LQLSALLKIQIAGLADRKRGRITLFLISGIDAGRDLTQEGLRFASRGLDGPNAMAPDRDPPGALPDAVLDEVASPSGLEHAEPKALHVVIPHEDIGLGGFGPFNNALSELRHTNSYPEPASAEAPRKQTDGNSVVEKDKVGEALLQEIYGFRGFIV
jgi:hypothetical protein